MWIDIEQNSDEWVQLRAGKVGGSSIGCVMANYGKAFGQPAHDLAVKIALEQITGIAQENSYSNAHMDRGHEQEPIARALYEQEFFCEVTNGGFYDNGDIGVSPDGLVGNNGLIEIKSVIYKVHYANIERKTFDPSYKWQLYLNLQQSDREWIDFVSFCADFPDRKKLYDFRIYSKDCADKFAMIELRMNEFRQLVAQKRKVIEAL